MSDELIKKEELFDLIKGGNNWINEKIIEKLEKLIVSSDFNHKIEFDNNENIYYIYDDECNLFVVDGKIILRCDRDNKPITFKEIEFKILNDTDIVRAYEKFKSTILNEA